MNSEQQSKIVYQGEPGANSHIACAAAFPDMEAVPCDTFEEAFSEVVSGDAALAMIPVENSVAGRVADIHHLLPESPLYIVGEHFQRVNHQLLALPGTTIEKLKAVRSHTMALGQCRNIIAELGLEGIAAADTAGAAREIAALGDPTQGAIASQMAAEIYGLDVLRSDIEDADHNTTRFLLLSRDPDDAEPDEGPIVTTFVFRVRNMPAALYKAMGGFATNGVNMTKLESYQIAGSFNATQFYADIEGHPSERPVQLAMEELEFFTSTLRVLGIYRGSPFRYGQTKKKDG